MTRYVWGLLSLLVLGLAAVVAWAAPIGYQAVPKDAFPVFDHPDMLTAEAAEREGAIYPRDIVIGVHHGREAKAYPITVMGTHELGNDTIDGIPIAVGW